MHLLYTAVHAVHSAAILGMRGVHSTTPAPPAGPVQDVYTSWVARPSMIAYPHSHASGATGPQAHLFHHGLALGRLVGHSLTPAFKREESGLARDNAPPIMPSWARSPRALPLLERALLNEKSHRKHTGTSGKGSSRTDVTNTVASGVDGSDGVCYLLPIPCAPAARHARCKAVIGRQSCFQCYCAHLTGSCKRRQDIRPWMTNMSSVARDAHT